MPEIRAAGMLEEGLRAIVREEVTAALRTYIAQGSAHTSSSGQSGVLTPLKGFVPTRSCRMSRTSCAKRRATRCTRG
jgi:hypothetical protein